MNNRTGKTDRQSHGGNISALEVVQSGPVIPVIVLSDKTQALPLAQALLAGGIRCWEITLRSPGPLPAIRRISAALA